MAFKARQFSILELTEFEAAMASVCEAALREMLGQSGFASTVYHLSRNGVSLPDCARRPTDFDDALSAVFNPTVATLIECKILSRFYKENAVDGFDQKDSLNFGDEVRRAREAFANVKT